MLDAARYVGIGGRRRWWPQTAGQETASFTHLMGIHACCGILKIPQQARLSPRHEDMDKTARFVQFCPPSHLR
jgi:hypothetical protein